MIKKLKPKHKRLIVVIACLCSIFIGIFTLLNNFKDNLIYFYSPKDLTLIEKNSPDKFDRLKQKQIRVGGMVKEKSYKKTSELGHEMTLTDFENDIIVNYSGILPPMFKEGQGIVALGKLDSKQNNIMFFNATTLITKHDENYMPPEVARSLNKSKSH
jgi:cytochrome c-type biogenesis protein CcmE